MVKKFLRIFKKSCFSLRNITKALFKVAGVFGALMLLSSTGFAAAGSGATLSSVQTALTKSIGTTATILIDISVIAGIGFIFASFFKAHAWKNNPTQVPLSQAISLLLIGGALTMFPQLITIPGKGILGGTSDVSKLGTKLSIIGAS